LPANLTAAEVACRFGLRRYPRSWRGKCPACDYATTFSVRAGRDGRALLLCASCQDRDALVEAVARSTGQERQAAQSQDHDEAARQQRRQDSALALWRGSVPAPGTPAERYLTARGLPGLAASPALRFRGDTPHPEGGRYPALIALVSNSSGSPVAVHRTFLTRDGRKAAVDPVKASLGPVWGGAVRLMPIEPDKPLVIGEGIETSASAGLLMGAPTWAAISAGNMAKSLTLPPEVRRVVIAADPDDAGRKAARDAWIRWKAEGREVRIAIPDGAADFNTWLTGRGTGHAG
jgi:putative DNA primase/helicase